MSAQADAITLKYFATYLDKAQDFAGESDALLKHEVVSLTLKSAITKLRLTLAPQSTHTANKQGVEPSTPDPAVALAKSYFEACCDLHCPDLIDTLLEKVEDTSTSAVDGPRRAKALTLPFRAYVAEYLGKHPELKTSLDLLRSQKAAPAAGTSAIVAVPSGSSTQPFTKASTGNAASISTRRSNESEQPPSKRRKTGEPTCVIDLTASP